MYVTFFARRRISGIDYQSLANFSFFDKWVSFTTLKKMNNIQKFDYLENILGNILMFIPMVFVLFLHLGKELRSWIILPLILLFSTIIEISQYELNRGVFDVDDIFLNFLGGLLGLFLFNLLKKNKIYFKIKFYSFLFLFNIKGHFYIKNINIQYEINKEFRKSY